MIKIEVTSSNDTDRLGYFLFYKDLIYVGSNHDADLYIPDDQISNNHIFLEVVDTKLLTHLGRGVEFMLINGKRTTSFKTLRVGDSVSLNTLTFKVLEYEASKYGSISNFLKERVSDVKANEPELMELLKTLGDEV